MPEIIEINEQLNRRFSSGCFMCGKPAEGRWRVKMLDPQNRPVEICVDCLLKQRAIRVKEKEIKNVRNEVNKGRGMEESAKNIAGDKDGKQQTEGKKSETGRKPETDVEG